MPLIRPRSDWGSTYDYAARHRAKPAQTAKRLVRFHHSVTLAPDLVAATVKDREDERAAMRLLESIGRARFGSGVSYNVAVMPSGEAYAGNPLDTKGTHSGSGDANYTEASIVLVGNYSKAKPTLKQRLKVARILVAWRKAGVIPTLTGCLRPHSETKATDCPGSNSRAAIPGIIAQAKVLSVVTPKPSQPAVPQFRQGRKVYRSKMRVGQGGSDSVWNLTVGLNRKGFAVHHGTTYTPEVRDAVAKFQRAQGWTGRSADGIPGKVTAERLGLVWVAD